MANVYLENMIHLIFDDIRVLLSKELNQEIPKNHDHIIQYLTDKYIYGQTKKISNIPMYHICDTLSSSSSIHLSGNQIDELEYDPGVEAEPEPEPEPVIEAEPEHKPDPEPEPVIEAEPEPIVNVEPEPEPKPEPEPEPTPNPEVETEAKTNDTVEHTNTITQVDVVKTANTQSTCTRVNSTVPYDIDKFNEYSEMKPEHLKTLCRGRGYPYSGTKTALISRLLNVSPTVIPSLKRGRKVNK